MDNDISIWMIAQRILNRDNRRDYHVEELQEDRGYYADRESALAWCSLANRSIAYGYEEYRNSILTANEELKPAYIRAMKTYDEALNRHEFLKSGGFSTAKPKLPKQPNSLVPSTFDAWWDTFCEGNWRYDLYIPVEIRPGVDRP